MILAAVPEVGSVSFWSHMGWVDVVLMIVFFLGVFLGLRKGLANALAGLIEVMAAQVVVVEYTAVVTAFLAERFKIPADVLSVALFAALAIATVFILRFLFKLLSLIATLEFKQPLNHVFGALVGGIQFILFFALLAEFLMMLQLPFLKESFETKSLSGPYLIQVCEHVHYFFERWIPASLSAA